MSHQPGILDPVPAVARYVLFNLAPQGADATAIRQALARLSPLANGSDVVVGLGPALMAALGAAVPDLHEFPDFSGQGIKVPATPGILWCWVRGEDLGDLLHLTRRVQHALAPAFVVRHVVDAFRHARGESGHGKDLTGYEDGTENPVGEAALEAAVVAGQGAGLDGASFVAVQQWVHDLDAFDALASQEQDHHFGRRRSDNEELEDSPTSAHVKRTAQEDFDPPAFMLRRSMPWMMSMQAGLMFVAFGKSLAAFEAQMRRMAGHDDGITDAMFRISRPVTGAYFWCPPLRDGRLDLRQLGF
ncbi:MAG TPA: Dyp-type peroxidase [Ramlibacter sp.]|nr:Dyp-type peroxidase [Ramlibacter sp.]